MFNKRQLEVILQLLGNATFKTPEARISVEVLEICEIISEQLKAQPTSEGRGE